MTAELVHAPETILVTGGCGFIGSNYIRHVLAQDESVAIVNLDLLTYAGFRDNCEGLDTSDRYVLVKGDICDAGLVADILRTHHIDTVVHFAAESHVDRSIAGPAPFIRTNVTGTFTLVEGARLFWLTDKGLDGRRARFHHISTDEVFGTLGEKDAPWTEASPYQPHSPYAASKAAADHIVRSYGTTYGLPYTLSNCSNNYGPRQHPEKLIPLVILNALSGREIPVYGDGGNIRDWLYVEDHCMAIHQIVTRASNGETYLVAGGTQPSNIDLVRLLCRIVDEEADRVPVRPSESLVQFVDDRPGHDRRYAMSVDKLEHDLGWRRTVDIEEGLRRTVRWYLENPCWVDALSTSESYRSWMNTHYKRGATTT